MNRKNIKDKSDSYVNVMHISMEYHLYNTKQELETLRTIQNIFGSQVKSNYNESKEVFVQCQLSAPEEVHQLIYINALSNNKTN